MNFVPRQSPQSGVLHRNHLATRIALVWMLFVLGCLRAGATGVGPVTVPITLHGVHIFVDITINGQPATFVLDTGASANVITPQAMQRLQLTPGKELTPLTGGAGRAGAVPQVQISTLSVGASRMEDQTAYVIPLPETLPCDGLLGTPFLENQVVTIDYEHSQLTMTPTPFFTPPAGASMLPLRMEGNTPFLEAKADGVKGWFRLDTGAGNGVSLFSTFVDQNHLRSKYTPSIPAVTGRSVGGLLYGDLTRLPVFSLGPFRLTNPVTELSRQTQGTFGDKHNAGNLGGEIWQRFTVMFDYPHSRVYLTRNALYDRSFNSPRSGIALDTEKGITSVIDVTPNSPGADAGVQVGDTVLTVDGIPVEQIQPWDLPALLRREPGTKVRLRLRAADKTERDVTLTLRDLL
ncbi:MAG TPA: aspartyl protease family protein [Chthonomonadaceae bacterium]|nr:aspartyl protease family protein [Chthonomonadaceae bacterium]